MEFIKRYSSILILIVIGFIPVIPLFHSGLPITHDGQDHVARIANFYASLSEGNIIPRWAENLNWGYGHPILMFLYPLPSYLASFFHFLGFSFVDSVKIVFGATYILSGLAMYLWVRNVFGERAGLLAGVLYMYAPYRFVDFYVRGAIGEHVAFLFAPLVFYFAFKIKQKPSLIPVIGGGLSLAGLLLSHNALALLFVPLASLYILSLIWKSKNKRLLTFYFAVLACLGFGLSAFFVIPALLEGKYTLRDMVTDHGEYRQGFVSILDFFIPSWSYGGTAFLSKQIGIVQLLGLVIGVYGFIKFRKNKFLFALLSLSLIVSLILMLPVTDFVWAHVSLLQKFQFPWRLLAIVVFVTSVLPSFIFNIKRNEKFYSVYVTVMCIAVVLLYYPYYQTNGYLLKPESFYTGIYKSTTDTGESSPRWSVRFMEHTPNQLAEVIEGEADIKQLTRTSTNHTYKIQAKTDMARIRENTLYFPNWQVFVNGQPVGIEFQDRQNRGLITYYVPKGNNNVTIEFNNTKQRILANSISLLSLLGLLVLIILAFVKKKLR